MSKIMITEHDEKLRAELINHLGEVFAKFGLGHCCGDLKLTRRFLKKHTTDIEEYKRLIRLLEASGGFCDCEVCFNVDTPWEIGEEIDICE